jgi:hypothetical protein
MHLAAAGDHLGCAPNLSKLETLHPYYCDDRLPRQPPSTSLLPRDVSVSSHARCLELSVNSAGCVDKDPSHHL